MPDSRLMTLRSFIQFSLMNVVLLGSLSTTGCTDKSPGDGPTPVLSGAPPTTFPLPPASNTSLVDLGWVILPSEKSAATERAKVGDSKGKVLVLDMYATWCAPCRQSIPHLSVLQDRYREVGLEIVGLNVGGPDDRVKVADFARQLGINYKLGFPDRELTDLLMSDDSSIPQTFVFSRDGRLVRRFIGYSEIASGELERLIKIEIDATVQWHPILLRSTTMIREAAMKRGLAENGQFR